MCTGRWAIVPLFALFTLTAFALSQAPPEDAAALQRIKRICVDRLAGPAPLADAVREMAFAALFSARRFTVLEKCEKAEATLKGAVLESGDRRTRAESEGIGFGAIAGGASAGAIAGAGGSTGESLLSSEARRQASVTLRLVDSEGVVLWAYTQDSTGGKTKGPAADAVDRAIRQLLRDTSRVAPEPK